MTATDNEHDAHMAEAGQPGDWLKLYRCIIESPVFASATLLKLWIWCLGKATYKKRSVPVKTGSGETIVELQPGQFIFGRDSAAKELDMPAGTVRARMKKLVDMQNIAMQPASHFSVVTVCNWHRYQNSNDEVSQASSQAHTRHSPPTRHKQESKEGKEEESNGQKPLAKRGQEGCSPDFSRFWEAYPRHEKRGRAQKVWAARIREGIKVEDLIKAAGNYAADCKSNQREKRFIMLPTTFLNDSHDFEDWISPASTQSPKARAMTPEELADWRPS